MNKKQSNILMDKNGMKITKPTNNEYNVAFVVTSLLFC